ncbi:MAG: formylglycine-generating enzyme family protein [Planctomycetaceae bacterium]|nr:formylglycine-generating enzyme family protein [Planctomycetaceae bacterium]
MMPRGIALLILLFGWPVCCLLVNVGPASAVAAEKKNKMASEPASARAPFDARQAAALQAVWSESLGVPVAAKNSLGVKMVLIPPGEFLMGSSEEQVAEALRMAVELKIDENTRKRIRETERPQHGMVIARPFFLAETEVTIGQFRQFVKQTGYMTQAEELGTANSADPVKAAAGKGNGFNWRSPGFAQREEAAVSQVTWNDAVVFCNWLSAQEDLPPAYQRDKQAGWVLQEESNGYRLPTEAEWEYAARAGSSSTYPWGPDAAPGGRLMANTWQGAFPHRNDGALGWVGTSPVGAFPPNDFGLVDMIGNVWEWTTTIFAGRHRLGEAKRCCTPSRGPVDPDPAVSQVLKGGSHLCAPEYCHRYRPAARSPQSQDSATTHIGFRCVR